jgi:hypothetical protein
MPGPYPNSAPSTLGPRLQSFFEATYPLLREQYIGPQVFPVMEVTLKSDTFGKVPIEELLRVNLDLARAPGAGYWRDSLKFETDSYTCQEYGAEEIVDRNSAARYANFISAYELATQRAIHKVLAAQEARVAGQLFDTGVYTGSTSQAVTNGTYVAANFATCTPVSDIKLAIEKVYTNSGVWPNTVIMNRLVFRNLRMCTQVLNAIKSDGAGDIARQSDVTAGQLAAVFDVDRVLVAGGVANTAGFGSAASISQIWGNHIMVCRTATSGDMEEPCVGRTFHWGADGSSMMGTVETYEEMAIRSDIVRVRQDCHEKRIYTELGCIIPSVI